MHQSVLIVEDDLPLRQLYRRALSLAGFDVREVGDGFDALQALDIQRPNVVVLDLALPRLDGYAVLDELRARSHMRGVRALVVTGSTDARVYDLDADCVMRKPVTADELVAAVRRCLAFGVSQKHV